MTSKIQTTLPVGRVNQAQVRGLGKGKGKVLQKAAAAVGRGLSTKKISRSSASALSSLIPELESLAKRSEAFIAVGALSFMAVLYFGGVVYYDERYYTPDEGLGYWLGVVGGVVMLLAYFYTAFKYVPALRTKAVMKHWLSVHLYFGMIGPFIIVVHSTSNIQSLNGGIALITTFLVFISGVVGRFLYSKTHFGLGGKKAKVKDIQKLLNLAGHKIKSTRLNNFTDSVVINRDTFPRAAWDLVSFGWRSRWLYFKLREDMRVHLKQLAHKERMSPRQVRQKQEQFKLQLRDYVQMLRKVALFHVYERFFAFWRNAHVPLLYLLLLSAIVHVIAVHMY